MKIYEEVSQLLLYAPAEDSILYCLAEAERNRIGIRQEIYKLVSLAETLGLSGNLWQGYLTWELIKNENPFSLACEYGDDPGGTLSMLARRDMARLQRLFRYDFGELDPVLRDAILNYDPGRERKCGENAGALVCRQRDRFAAAESDSGFAERLTGFYRTHGAGTFALNGAFRVREGGYLAPIRGLAPVSLSDIVGYATQKERLVANTEAFLAGKPANNVLLYGDGGTGKSTCVRALLHEYENSGLRMIELYKHQFRDLSPVITRIKDRNYRFIIFIDDLSFEEHEIEYKYLKAVIEGGVETRPENVLLYATSNRRHIIRETWNDRNDMEHSGDIHRSDTVEEKLSLASRFGEAINFSAPDRKLYHEIVRVLAAKQLGGAINDEALILGADAWEIRRGGVSGRTAQQYIDHLAGKPPEKEGKSHAHA